MLTPDKSQPGGRSHSGVGTTGAKPSTCLPNRVCIPAIQRADTGNIDYYLYLKPNLLSLFLKTTITVVSLWGPIERLSF